MESLSIRVEPVLESGVIYQISSRDEKEEGSLQLQGKARGKTKYSTFMQSGTSKRMDLEG